MKTTNEFGTNNFSDCQGFVNLTLISKDAIDPKRVEKTNFDLEFSFLFAKSVGRGQSHRKLVTGTGMPTSPIYKKT